MDIVERVFLFIKWGSICLTTFLVVFYPIDYFTSTRSLSFNVALPVDRLMPYCGSMFYVYAAALLLPFFVPLLAACPGAIKAWGRKMVVAILVSGIIYLIFPVYNDRGIAGAAATDFSALMVIIAGKHNFLPSLHVSLSLITLKACWRKSHALLQAWLVSLAILMIASTLLTWQHYFADVIAAIVVFVSIEVAFKRKPTWRQ